MEDIRSKISEILVDKMGIMETEITPDANIVRDLGIDSLDYAELVMEFETTFNIRIPDNDAQKIVTVQDAVKYIHNKTEK